MGGLHIPHISHIVLNSNDDGLTAAGLFRWTHLLTRTSSYGAVRSSGSVCEVRRLHLISMSADPWASGPVLPWDSRNVKWSSLRISFHPLPLFFLDAASLRGGEGDVCERVRGEPFSHQPTAQGFRFQLHNRLGSEELENDQVNLRLREFSCRCSEYLQPVGSGGHSLPPHLSARCADQSERLSTAGR